MKRWVLILIAFLLAGAIINVAVAWGCATWVSPRGPHVATSKGWHAPNPPIIQGSRELDYQIHRAESFGTTRIRATMGWSDRTGAKGPDFASISPYWSRFPEPLQDRSPTGMNMNGFG